MGAPWIAIREYHLPKATLLNLVIDLVRYAEKTQTRISVWRSLDVAITFHIGLHLPFKGWQNAAGKNLGVASVPLLGVSVHTKRDVDAIEHSSGRCDYITLSPLYNSFSKKHYSGMGYEKFRTLCAHTQKPTYALGGISTENANCAFDAGAYGIAVCGAAISCPKNIKIFLEKIRKRGL